MSAVRATGRASGLRDSAGQQIAQLGEPLYRKMEPTGYSSANSEWVNSAALLARMNFALALADNRVPGSKVDTAQFENDPAAVARQVLFREPTQQTLESIEKALAQKGADAGAGGGLVLGSPDFQRR